LQLLQTIVELLNTMSIELITFKKLAIHFESVAHLKRAKAFLQTLNKLGGTEQTLINQSSFLINLIPIKIYHPK